MTTAKARARATGAKPDPRLAALYQALPAEFTAKRNALAGELPEVKRLKKPSWPLWAVNQLAGRHPTAVQALLEAGGELAGAHRDVLSGRADAGALREASRAHGEALARAERLASELLVEAGAGAGPGNLRRARATLHAASVGGEAERAALASGIVAEELTPPDVLSAEPGALPAARPAPRAPGGRDTKDARDVKAAREQAKRQAAAARRRAAEAARVEKARALAKAKAARLEARAAALEDQAAALREQARGLRRGSHDR